MGITKKKILFITTMIVIASLSGCSGKVDESEYYKLKSAYEEMNYTLDIQKYKEAILFLSNSNIIYKEYIEENKDKFTEVIDNSLLNTLESKAIEKPASEEMKENFKNLEEEQYGNVDIKQYEYPIYGNHYRIISYGTKEESEKSIEQFKNLPDNTIMGTSIYVEMVTFKVDNKYYGEYMVRVKIKDDKIIDYYIFM